MQTSTSISANSAIISSIRYAALSLGIFFLFLGLAGFVPAFVTPPTNFIPNLGFGYIFGLFPTNYFHNALGILFGVWGLAAFTSLSGSIVFTRIFAIVYAVSAILGLFPFTNTVFGITPLFGNNVLLNVFVAAIAFYFCFVKSAEISTVNTPEAAPKA